MILTVSVEWRCLRTGALCIVQGDEVNKLKYIEEMAAGCDNAQITIATADVDIGKS